MARGLVVYVTSHGFGHLNRTVAVLNRVAGSVPVTIRCHPDLFDHWRDRLRRPAALEGYISDAGAVNPPGDSAATDGPATLARAAAVHAEAMAGLGGEVERLGDLHAGAVLSDAPPVPLVAARRAGVPGFVLANFTWADIYAPLARRATRAMQRFVVEVRDAYRQAHGLFRAEPALPMSDFEPEQVIEVGLVGTPGVKRSDELRRRLGLCPKVKVVYVYLGRYGQEGLAWDRVAALGEQQGIHFVSFHPPPDEVGAVPNFHRVPLGAWTGADLTASVNAVVAKAGYGTVCEAMAAGTPILYPPRVGFAEHRALDRALQRWGGGLRVAAPEFAAFDIQQQLEQAFELQPGPPPFPTDGAQRVADHLMRICQGKPAETVPGPVR